LPGSTTFPSTLSRTPRNVAPPPPKNGDVTGLPRNGAVVVSGASVLAKYGRKVPFFHSPIAIVSASPFFSSR
jgi:hypothetical protein